MHSSRMRTGCSLSVFRGGCTWSWGGTWSRGVPGPGRVPGPRGVPGLGGVCQVPPRPDQVPPGPDQVPPRPEQVPPSGPDQVHPPETRPGTPPVNRITDRC